MVASKNTVERIIQVMLRHIDEATFQKIMKELKDIPGNKSFRDTIERMEQLRK